MPVNDLEKVVIDKPIIIPQGRNATKYINKEIGIEAQIICEGNLVFENCIINYEPFENKKRIILKEGSDVQIINCTLKGIAEEYRIAASYFSSLSSGKVIEEYELNERISDIASFIEYENHYDKCNLEINNSLFIDCSGFAKVYNITVKNSVFEYSTKEIASKTLYAESGSNSSIANCVIKFTDNDNNIKIGDFSAYSTDDLGIVIINKIQDYDGDDELRKIKDKFKGLSSETEGFKYVLNLYNDYIQKHKPSFSFNDFLFYLITVNNREKIFKGFKKISYTSFNGVFSVIGESSIIKSCIFNNCAKIISDLRGEKYEPAIVEDSVFINCRQNLINSRDSFKVINCKYFNIRTRGDIGISGPSGKDKGEIKDCTFNGLDIDSSFIESKNNGGFDGPNVTVENCNFKNCVTNNNSDIISKNKVSLGMLNWKEATAITIKNCPGHDIISKTGKADSIPTEHKDKNNDIIGANLDEN